MRGEFTRVPVNKRRRRSNRITRRILTRKRSWWRVCSVFPAFSPLDSWRLASITVFKLVLCLARKLSHIFTSNIAISYSYSNIGITFIIFSIIKPNRVTRKTSWSTPIFVNLFLRIPSELNDLSLFLTHRNTSNLNANSIKKLKLEIGTRKHRKPLIEVYETITRPVQITVQAESAVAYGTYRVKQFNANRRIAFVYAQERQAIST